MAISEKSDNSDNKVLTITNFHFFQQRLALFYR